ncbi:MAG TPA: serine protease [Solirubrobacteraceae bacterium]
MLIAVDDRRRYAWLALLTGALTGALWGSVAVAAADARLSAPPAVASVVGGAGAPIARFPFQVALYNPQTGSPAAGFFCGGVILDATHVVTAAHCVVGGGPGHVNVPSEMSVLAGSTHLSPTDPGGVRDAVAYARYDSRYNPFTSDFDVGMLTLSRPLWGGATPPSIDGVHTIAPIAIDAGHETSGSGQGSAQAIMATVSGWGDVNPAPGTGPSYPLGLRATQLPLVPEGVCEEDYAAIEQTITPRMLCAGSPGRRVDSCYGDSGGPLVVDRDTPAHPPEDYVLVGLVDFGNGCAQPGYPGVYARIADPEIERFLAAGVGHRASIAGRQSRKRKRKRGRPR